VRTAGESRRSWLTAEYVCADGKLDGKPMPDLDIDVRDVPVTVIDGVPITGLQRAQIEQAIGWIGF